MIITEKIVDQVFLISRYSQLHEVLTSIIQCAIGSSAQGLAYQGFALAKFSALPTRRIVDVHGKVVEESSLSWLEQDRLLSWLNLQIAVVADNNEVNLSLPALIASARLGLVARILDMAHQHLRTRKSFGQKTTRHQLIKASFSDIYGDIIQLKYQLFYRIETGNFQGMGHEHKEITRLGNQAEKLMGGHGYLMGATHTVSYLSIMLYSLFGKQSSNKVTT